MTRTKRKIALQISRLLSEEDEAMLEEEQM